MTEQQVLAVVADALDVPCARLHRSSVAADFAEWDSMGTLAILTALAHHGVSIEPWKVDKLQSVDGILSEVLTAGMLK